MLFDRKFVLHVKKMSVQMSRKEFLWADGLGEGFAYGKGEKRRGRLGPGTNRSHNPHIVRLPQK